jgi:hypothetical protein
MPQDPFPAQGRDGQEPDGSPPPAGAGSGPQQPDNPEPDGSVPLPPPGNGPETAAQSPGDDPEGPGQGLFVCLPAEELSLAGFAQDGRADTMAPGPLLAEVVHAVLGEDGAGLAELADDQLIGVISAARRMESRAAWTLLAGLRELARRRPPGEEPGDSARCGVSDFAADEVADELHLTVQSASAQIGYACDVAGRLPRTFAALAAGQIHPVHLRIIEDETRILSAQDAARADEQLAGSAGSLTFGRLRHAAHRLVLQLDPDSALRRKESARQDAHVSRFREDSGNAGMIARELPPDEVLASWQHIEQRALDLRAAGMSGTLQELRVRAYLDLLQERDSRATAAGPAAAGTGEADDDGGSGDPRGSRGPGGNGGPGSGPQPSGPAGADPGGPAHPARADAGPSVATMVTITVPFETLTGRSGTPGEAGGFGLVDAEDARDLVAAAARHPDTRWCVTALHPDGTAAAHGCAPGRGRPPPGPADIAPDGDTPPGPDPPPGTLPRDYVTSLRIRMAPVARGRCEHQHAEAGYRPSRTLQHLVRARNARCTAPGCGRAAARCDLDHTVAWDQGGLTCECDLSPLCRRHHRCKQAQGWRLEQPEPGVLVWRTPAGRTYATTPTAYPT